MSNNYYLKYLKYKNKYLTLKKQFGGANYISVKTPELSDEIKEHMFNMYITTYGGAGQELWFKTVEKLFSPNYTCGIILDNTSNTLIQDIKPENIKVFSIYQLKKYVNKLSLTCHDGTNEGKQAAVNLRLEYIKKPGWILEASGATSWILRKNKAPRIDDIVAIKKFLDIDDVKEKICMNDEFDPDDKNSFSYYHIYHKNLYYILYKYLQYNYQIHLHQ